MRGADMSFNTGIGRALSLLSYLEGGSGSSRRTFTLSSEDEKFTLPVTPWEYSVSSGQMNKTVSITQVGEALVFSNPKLRTLRFGCFFPSLKHEYPFVVGDEKEPTACIELLTKWKESKKPIRVVISDSPVNMSMAIMSLEYREQDGTGDIYYQLELTEYKELTIKNANENKQILETTGLKERQSDKAQATEAKVYNGSDILDAAKRAYGQYNRWRKVAESNNLESLVISNSRGIAKRLKIPKS